MDVAIIEEVLKEILQQQKEMAAEYDKEVETKQEVLLKLEAFNKRLDTLKVPVDIDASPVLTPIRKWIEELKAEIVAQPVPLVQEKSFQLFASRPEEFYKFIFGALFKGLAILVVGVYFLAVVNRYIREREYLHYKQAWQYLYSSQKEDYKMYFDKTWNESQKEKLLNGNNY